MNDPKLVEDGFYEDCLELSRTKHQSRDLRIALVSRGGQQGLDIHKFKTDGRPATGILLDSDQVGVLTELIRNSEVLDQFVMNGAINFNDYKEEN